MKKGIFKFLLDNSLVVTLFVSMIVPQGATYFF